MRFLILTPVLNGARYLNAAIASVRAQTHFDWRLVVLDAASSDGSLEIARGNARDDARISVRSAPDGGMYDALRRGLDDACGQVDVLAWLNSDDLYTPWAFAEAAAAIAQDARWVTGLPGLFDAEGRLRAVAPRGANRRSDILKGRRHDGFLGAIQQESTFFTAALYADLSEEERDVFAAQALAGDFHLWRCFARRTHLTTVPSVLGGFRLHADNRSLKSPEAYQNEADALGATCPPRAVARIWRRLHDLGGAMKALKAYEAAAAALSAEAADARE